jgi:hypothetical protein
MPGKKFGNTNRIPDPTDDVSVRLVTLILAAVIASAESHPSWWTLAEPEATALVGIQWDTLRDSPFGDAVRSELSGDNLGFPDVAMLRDAKQMLISSPAVLAILSGNFPVEVLHEQAASKGLKSGNYRGIELFISPGKNTLSIAQLTDQLLLVGLHKTLERAIDRSLAETGRRYSPLLPHAARIAQGKDLWVVATQLPDPLASLFVPLEAEAQGFEGAVSVRDGVQLEATLDAGSPGQADAVGENLRQSIPSLPPIARAMRVTVESRTVLLDLQVTRDQLIAAMQPAELPAPKPMSAPVKELVVEEPVPTGPQVIRIFGLDEGTREIVLPPLPKKPI